MLSQELISEVLTNQNEIWLRRNSGIVREKLTAIKMQQGFANIIIGVRRCGKSTLMHQLLGKLTGNSLFINFEDPRLTGFEMDDFRRLDKEITQRNVQNLFFDEVQMLDNWEVYVRQKLDENYTIIVTGSNASLLSKELGTKLTGRHLSYELFPFSYSEYLLLEEKARSLETFSAYLDEGGFPDFIKTKNPAVLHHLLDDILMRDIAVRFGIRDSQSLRKLAVYLLSNVGKLISAGKLTQLFGIKAPSTILEYLSYLEDAYLIQFIPKFSYSLKVQLRNPKKVYAIDLGLQTYNSVSFSKDKGRKLENLVFLHYRRLGKEIYYYHEKVECDFVIFDKGKIEEVLQVCYDVNEENLKREINGLTSAMDFFGLTEGKIITFNQTENYQINGKNIDLIPYQILQ